MSFEKVTKFQQKLKKKKKQSMILSTMPFKLSINTKLEEKKEEKANKGHDRKKNTLKERQQKQYPFSDSNVPRMLDDLLQANLIELLEMKRPEESDHVNDPNICRYHRLISHPAQKCFFLKDKIIELYARGEVTFDEEGATSNMATIGNINLHVGLYLTMLKFRSFEPIQVLSSTASLT